MTPNWIWSVVATVPLAIGAVSAQPDPRTVTMAVPSVVHASLPASPEASPMDPVAARSAIEKANADWLTAFRKGDSDSLARIYAPDASLFPPSNVSLEGRDRIVEYFGAQRKAGMGDASLKTLEVVCVGDVAYEVGTYGFRFDGDANSVAADSGRYFAIWKARPDGVWRYHVGIWSSNRDAVAAR